MPLNQPSSLSNTTSITDRLSSLGSQIVSSTTTSSRSSTTTMAGRPFITCHVLDTISGKPAAGIAVSLQMLRPDHALGETVHTATTNSDGRVAEWSGAEKLAYHVDWAKSHDIDMIFSLRFDTESYFGKGNTFWPEVELHFNAKKDEGHYHVPLLLGPWSYTTYRGS